MTLKCRRGEKRFVVVVVGGDPSDSHAARSIPAAMDMANPDPGTRVALYATCARDGGAARLNYQTRGKFLRQHRSNRRG